MNHSLNIADVDLLEIVTAAFEGDPDRVRMHLDRAGVSGWLASTHLRDVGWSTESLREEIVDEQDQKIEEAEEEGWDNGYDEAMRNVSAWVEDLKGVLFGDPYEEDDLVKTVREFIEWHADEVERHAPKVKAAA